MKLVLDQPRMKPFDPMMDVRVLVACEDSSAAVQVCDVLGCLERFGCNDGEPEGRLIYQWWNFEVLGVTSLRELASHEAAAADLIIVAAHERQKLPEAVAGWMTRWRDLRHGRQGGALVALLGSNFRTPDATGEIFSQLKESALLGHMDFFISTNHWDEDGGDDAGDDEAVRQFVMRCLTRQTSRTMGLEADSVGHLPRNAGADYGCNN